MKKFILSFLATFSLVFGTMYLVTHAAPITPVTGGGTQTSTIPLSGQTLIGNSLGTYTPAYISCSAGCTITTSSAGIAISVSGVGGTVTFLANGGAFVTTSTINFQAGTNVTITTSTNGTYTINSSGGSGSSTAVVGINGVTSTVSGSTTTVSLALNGSSTQTCTVGQGVNLLTSNGLIGCTPFSSLTTSTLNGLYLQIANNLSDLSSTSSARTSIGYSGSAPISISATGTIIFTNPGYITTSTFNVTGTANALTQWNSSGNGLTSFGGSNCTLGYVAIGNSASGTLTCTPASSTAVFYVDGNRTDSYTQTGSYLYPFKTMSQAIASSTGFAGYSYIMAPTNSPYVDGAPDTFPNVPFTIFGNQSTWVPVSGVTMPNSFDIYDLTIAGNVTESDTSTLAIHQFNNGVITGNLFCNGLCINQGENFPTTTSTISIARGSISNFISALIQSNIINAGTLNLDDVEVINNATNTTGYAIYSSSTGATVSVNGMTFIGLSPLTQAIYVNNGATSTPNNLNAFSITVNTSTLGSTITAGSAATVVSNVTGLTNLAGTFIAPSGTAFSTSYDEVKSILGAFSVGTSTVTNNQTTINQVINVPLLAANSFLATNGSSIIVTTSTPLGGGGNVYMNATSSAIAGNVPYIITSASSTVTPSSSLSLSGSTATVTGSTSSTLLVTNGLTGTSTSQVKIDTSTTTPAFILRGADGTFMWESTAVTTSTGAFEIMRDTGGTTCTKMTTNAGVGTFATTTCPL